jgi:DNA (cytosine-5)-methyltransferase 1
MNNLTLGSLFDGSGGFPLGGLISGITPVWASEIEPFPIRVTSKRIPFMKHYGDISQMDGGKIEPVDIITFGSPCTDMSVAGKRAGLDGQQSVLFYQAIRIIKEMRCATNGKYPRYIVWENVPGAFSSNAGQDFKAVLEAVIGVAEPNTEVPMPEKGRWAYADCYMGDGWSVAYRTLDAQFWGVPQRRKRIYLVADFAGRSAFDILFKSEGLSRYSPQSFRSWQRASTSLESCPGTSGFDGYNGDLTKETTATPGTSCGLILNDQGGYRMDVTEEVTCTLRAEAHHPPCVLSEDVVPLENHPNDGRIKIEDEGKVQTLSSRMGTGGNNVPLVLKIRSGCEGGGKGALIQENRSATLSCNNDQTLFEPCNWDGEQVAPTLTAHNAGGNQRMPDKNHFNCVIEAYGICSKDSNAMKSSNPHSGIYKAETSRTIDGNGGNPGCNQGGIAVVCIDQGGGKSSCNITTDKAPTLTCTHAGEPAVYAMSTGGFAQIEEECSPTLLARDYKDPNAVCYGIGRDAYNQGANAKYMPSIDEEKQPTLIAKGPGAVAHPYGFDPSASRDVGQYFLEDCGNTLVNGSCPGHHNGVLDSSYTVRRLTPTECARLQGFPDWWCDELGTEEPTEEEIRYWGGVFETHRKIMGDSTKAKTEKQIIKWLRNPHSDAAEYKMWGNGVALPCVVFVLSGIVYYTQNEGE